MTDISERPPSVDALARQLAASHSLPHPLLVDCARRAIASAPTNALATAQLFARDIATALLQDVINATGVLLHTNLGRAPLAAQATHRANNLEFNLASGERGSRHTSVSQLISALTGAESAIVVNNNAAAVLLVAAALAPGRDIAVSRGESVEIGGGFRIPEVIEQSGARLVDVGTTNRTRLRDYEKALSAKRNDIALVMKIHPSNFALTGFIESTTVAQLASLPVPIVADIGSGLIDNTCPWLVGYTPQIPSWLVAEPAAKQAIADGASVVTFSGDKLLGGPQCGIIAGKKEFVDACAAHPLMRAFRPGNQVMMPLQKTLLAYLNKTVCTEIPFWVMASTATTVLTTRAHAIADSFSHCTVVSLNSLVGAGSAPGTVIDSVGIAISGDRRAQLRSNSVPIVARTLDNMTYLDMRTIHPSDDGIVANALSSLA